VADHRVGRRLWLSKGDYQRTLADDHPEAALRPLHRRAKRRLKYVRGLADWFRESFPDEWEPGSGYWNYKVPVDGEFVDGPRAHPSVRRACMEYLIQAAIALISARPANSSSVRVCATVWLPELFQSELTVIFTDDYFREFVDRPGPTYDDRLFHRWEPLAAERSLLKEWRLDYPLDERGFSYVHRDATFDPPWEESGEVWLIGDLKTLPQP
jgi:hypothetical protein